MISLSGVKKSYASVQALAGIDLKIEEGEIFLLLGPNGSGKTTLMKIIMGLLFPDEGNVVFQKKVRIGYMQEEKFAKTDWSVEQYLRFIGELGGMSIPDISNRLSLLLKRYGLHEKKNTKIRELSKGLRQRVKWMQALFLDPDLYILDEPTSGLDPICKVEMRQWIKNEYERGKTILITSHLLDEMEKIGSRFVILHQGKIKGQGAVSDLKTEDLESFFYRIVKETKNENHY
jgi:ABC-2 type transport system ATP-binding protein